MHFTGITFSVRMNDVAMFKHHNPTYSVSVHMYGCKDGLYPIQV